ncbi:MAG: transglycosylase domain-containing protein [Bacteroidia bacterium]|nr:transglycosylase domain-containing protein [Bacteroidia bacterium]MCF8427217.1 transglycosylase domain-containing protein [Bacteroidia bacterium]MCF8446415.1 transglycosylase domain-containing protein [Bacteroidia bacterium]
MKLNQYFTKSPYWKWIKWLWIGAFLGVLLLSTLVGTIAMGWFGQLPPIEELENPTTQLASEIYADDGSQLGKYYLQNRSNASYEELSPQLINALIATEDIRFYQHSGIDNSRLFTMVIYNLIGRRQGGSTISQQLAKNLFPRKKFRSVVEKARTKIQEWITAVLIEQRYTKDEILTMYFNTVEFGSNSFGIRSASKTFFGKSPKDLNAKEAAMLVGMLKAPTLYSPVRNPANALRRRNTVLNQMEKAGYLTSDTCELFKSEAIELNFAEESHNEGLATYFRETLRMELLDWCEENGYNLYKDGLKIYTTINPTMQKIAEETVESQLRDQQKLFFAHWKGRDPWGEFKEVLISGMKRSDRYRIAREMKKTEAEIMKEFNTPVKMRVFSYTKGEIDTTMTPMDSIKYYKHFMQCGFMSMDPQTGKIKAWVGGTNYKYFKYDHVNITAKRQVGSTFKPFVYSVAVDNGFSPCTMVPDKPVSFDGYPDYNPGNADTKYDLPEMTMFRGLKLSINLICLNVLKMLGDDGIKNVIDLAKKMGVTSKIEPYPSSALGTADISVYEMVGAFSTFANKGVWIKPNYLTRIVDKNGNVIFENLPITQEALSEQTAYVMCKMLEQVTTTGTAAKIKYQYKIPGACGGKTGTTQNYSDGWFIGITPTLVSGCWVGWEDRAIHFRSLNLGSGSAMAMPIWANYMQKVTTVPNLLQIVNEWTPPQSPLSIEMDCDKFSNSLPDKEDFVE